MPPVTIKEYRIPAELSDTVDNQGPQLQALVNDPTKIPDGTRVIFPANGKIRTDAGLRVASRKNLIFDFEGCALTTPVDTVIGGTYTDCVVTNPTNPSATTGTAVYSASAHWPWFGNQLWWAMGPGAPGGPRVGWKDAHNVGLDKPVPCGSNKTITLIAPGDRARTLLALDTCDHVAINNYKAIGPNEAGGRGDAAWVVQLEAQHALAIGGCVDLQIVNPDLAYIFGDCIATMRGAVNARLSSFVDIIGANLHNNGRSGFTPKGITDWTLQNPNMNEIRRNAIDIEPNSPKDTCRRGKITGGSIKGYRFAWLSGTAYGNVDADVGDISAHKVELGPIHAVITPGTNVRWGPFTFTGLTATAISGIQNGSAIGFTRCDQPVVAGCKMMLQAGRNMHGVYTKACTDPAVFWNDWSAGVGEWVNAP